MSVTKAIIQKFYALAHEAERIDDEEPEAALDVPYEAVLDHILAHPEARQDFTDAFMDAIRTQSLSPGIISYCVHGLRWNDLRQKIASLLEIEKSERTRHHLRSILEAFGDDWDMADAFRRFS